MALPAILLPFAPLLKGIAFGSIKFALLGIGSQIAPVQTANIYIKMTSSSTPKSAQHFAEIGKISDEEYAALTEALKPVLAVITQKELYMSRKEAQQFLKMTLMDTWSSVCELFMNACRALKRYYYATISWCENLWKSDNKFQFVGTAIAELIKSVGAWCSQSIGELKGK